MQELEEADEIISTLRGPQQDIVLLVYTFGRKRFEFKQVNYSPADGKPMIPLQLLYKADAVLNLTNQTTYKYRFPAENYDDALQQVLDTFPKLVHELEELFPYRTFR